MGYTQGVGRGRGLPLAGRARPIRRCPSLQCHQPAPSAPPQVPPARWPRAAPAPWTSASGPGPITVKDPQSLIISLIAYGGFFAVLRSAAFFLSHRAGKRRVSSFAPAAATKLLRPSIARRWWI